ncbi:GNAT family N-acetyltransferase [Actinomadura rubrisoli]|uniref:GNAT family N-acetyltransferase n=1 Tax=Actinomadura rubrisoli TaxID=2530368 RepID=A0A4R5BMR7_9ACTN|nr:GNAT family N-acetyltransferase [Actinomadura rubrisoli]
MTLRVMEVSDIPFAVDLHVRHLYRGFFVDLGERFLEHYHRSFITSAAGVALVGELDGRPAGFLLGTIDEAAHRRHLARLDRVRLIRAGTISLVARPGQASRFLRTRARRYAGGLRTHLKTPGAQRVPTGVLHHVAVEEASRQAGVGRALAHGFTEITRLHGTRRLRLYTEPGNHQAQAFYQGLGWTAWTRQGDIDGRPWAAFVLDL